MTAYEPHPGPFPVTRSLKSIAETVARHTSMTAADLRGRSRTKVITRARMMFYVVAFDYGYSMSDIGDYMGRDHSTVITGARTLRAKWGPENEALRDRIIADLRLDPRESAPEMTPLLDGQDDGDPLETLRRMIDSDPDNTVFSVSLKCGLGRDTIYRWLRTPDPVDPTMTVLSVALRFYGYRMRAVPVDSTSR